MIFELNTHRVVLKQLTVITRCDQSLSLQRSRTQCELCEKSGTHTEASSRIPKKERMIVIDDYARKDDLYAKVWMDKFATKT